LQDYYKGKLTENALLNKPGWLAAEEHLILNDPNIPASMAVKMVKPIVSKEDKLVKRLQTGTTGPIYQGTEEPTGMMDALVENLLKQILKGVNKESVAPIIIKEEPASSKKKVLKRKSSPKKRPILTKLSTSKKAATPSTSKKSGYSEATQKVLRSLGLADNDGCYSPKDIKGKKPKKAKKTELQKLQEGWENWYDPQGRHLNYELD